MNELISKNFHGHEVHTFLWNEKLCWIAGEISTACDYADGTNAIQECIKAEKFAQGDEYDVLARDELREFKQFANSLTRQNLVSANTKALTVFYESGIYGFIQYTSKPIGVEFRTWLRRDVLPEIRETGAYVANKSKSKKLRSSSGFSLPAVTAAIKTAVPILREAGMEPPDLALAMQQMYRQAGFELNVDTLQTDRKFFTREMIADMVGLLSKASGEPYGTGVSAILQKIDVAEDERRLVRFENNGHPGEDYQFAETVVKKVEKWLSDNNYPATIPFADKNGRITQRRVIYRQ